jgi:gamma-glutamylputrescine oxidase
MIISIKEKVFWHDTVDMPMDRILNDLPPKVDLAVIGAGIPGLAAAYQLAKRGVSVAVLEAVTIGWGASSRNGGMVLTGRKLDAGVVEKRYGAELTRQLFDDSIASISTVEQLVIQEHISCDFKRTGHLLLANKPVHYAAMQQEAEWFSKHFNYQTILIPRNDLPNEIGSEVYYGGLVDETSAGLNPAQYVFGLAKAAERAGAVLCPHARLVKIEKNNEGFILKTHRGELLSSQVLVTTGGYTGLVPISLPPSHCQKTWPNSLSRIIAWSSITGTSSTTSASPPTIAWSSVDGLPSSPKQARPSAPVQASFASK